MSIERDMKECTLQKKMSARGKSGAKNYVWKDVRKVRVAIYKNSELIISTSARYKDSTHTGLTHCREIVAGKYRLVKDGVIYQIISSDTNHRLTNLILKAVETDV